MIFINILKMIIVNKITRSNAIHLKTNIYSYCLYSL